jgi:phosphatidylglycerophosphate synthase
MAERRPIAARSNNLIQRLARTLARTRITPNQISVMSVGASLLAPVGLLAVGGAAGALIAIAGIQLRLLANVLDGLVAVEGGKSSPLGALYNEFPDRIADSVILASMGYAAGVPGLGWAAALVAALTAYVRVFGGALGQPQSFGGPMAKQHRMALATLALLLTTYPVFVPAATIIIGTLGIIVLGSLWTCVVRTRFIVHHLEHP